MGVAETLRLVCILLIVFVVQIAYVNGPYRHHDESITWTVVERLQTENTLDTNWNHEETPEDFRYEQYNFSSYFIASRFLVELTLLPVRSGIFKIDPRSYGPFVGALRINSALFGLLTCVLVYVTIRRILKSEILALLGFVLIGVAPLWVQATHCARPETFTGVLSIAITLLALPGGAVGLVIALFLGGILIACKISTVFVVIPPALVLVVESWRERRWRLFILGCCSPLVGAVLGMPYAFANPLSYCAGVAGLREQYGSHILPFSTVGTNYQFARSVQYFADTQGVLFLVMLLAGVIWLVLKRDWIKLALIAGPPLMTWLFFCFQVMFFERNLAHVLPQMAVLVVLGSHAIGVAIRKYLKSSVAVSLLAVALGLGLLIQPWSISWTLVFQVFSGEERAALASYHRELVRAQSRERGYPIQIVRRDVLYPYQVDQLGKILEKSEVPIILAFQDLNDPGSRCVEDAIRRYKLVRVGRFSSVFDALPKNGIRIFFSPSFDYFLFDSGASAHVEE